MLAPAVAARSALYDQERQLKIRRAQIRVIEALTALHHLTPIRPDTTVAQLAAALAEATRDDA